MSVVAISPRPHPAGRARPGRPGRPVGTDGVPSSAPSRATSTLTVTVELTPGELTPRLARLVELLRELAESGEGTLRSAPPPRPAAQPWASAEHGPRPEAAAPRPLTVAPLPEDPDAVRVLAASRVVRQGSRVIPLTRIEFDLLHFLATHPRRVFTRLQLLSNVWGYEHAIARTVDVHVRRLRAKLGAANPVVTTVYGVGYRLADEARVTVDPHR